MLAYFLLITLLITVGNILIQITYANNQITTTQKHKGFSLKLIHRNAPNSPLYEPNLTKAEEMRKYVQWSKLRLQLLARQVSNTNKSQNFSDWNRVIRPQMFIQDFTYLVKVGLGTFRTNPRYHTTYLGLDTGSQLSWTQCRGCLNYIHQVGPKFAPSESRSYRPFSCHHCPPPGFCEDGICRQVIRYGDRSHAKVNLAYETFILQSAIGIVKLRGLAFGCGIDMFGFREGIDNF